jgi:hypothetical protein
MEVKLSRHIFEKYSKIKFHENLSSGSRVVPDGQTDRQTNMTKVMSLFKILRKRPKRSVIPVSNETECSKCMGCAPGCGMDVGLLLSNLRRLSLQWWVRSEE